MGIRKRPVSIAPLDILLTGTFHSENWALSHLRPLAMSKRCRCVRVVSIFPIAGLDKVEFIQPKRWMMRIFGEVPARLFTFFYVAMRTKPDIVGGFHLLLNGLVAVLVSRLVGSHSIYFCVGAGPTEVLHTGQTENRLFRRLGERDEVIEKFLLNAVDAFDEVITMGSGAARFFQENGIARPCHIMPGGIDAQQFSPSNIAHQNDLVFVGRLVPVKRIDLFLQVVRCVKTTLPNVSAIIVGDGPLRETLELMAKEADLDENVSFIGYRGDVEEILKRTKIFVLTSDSEGLALSLMEAMMCGVPGIVSRVGDLADLVEDGVNGYLVDQRTPDAFAARIISLLNDPERRLRFGNAARQAALKFDVASATKRWDRLLEFTA